MFVSNGITITDENARQVAKTLPYIASGVSRSVYDLGDVVLKVDDGGNYAGNCASEVAAWEEFEGTEHEHLFARILAYGRGWIIAEKACTDYAGYRSQDARDVIAQLEWLGIGDLHENNIGFREDGSACAIDYAMNCHRHNQGSEDFISSDPCECGDHECSDCYPNGCECCCSLHIWSGCATYEGCNRRECEECYCIAEIHIPEDGEWFGFKFGVCTPPARGQGAAGIVRKPTMRHYCAVHAPVSESSDRCEVIGQRVLWLAPFNSQGLLWSRLV